MRSQRDFVADASHQLRTPVTGLRLRVEAARADTRDPEVAEELDAALAELDRLTHIIEELLQLSQAGERSAGGERLALGELGARAAERWDALAAEKEQRLVADGRGASGAAWLSRADADRILDALVENAIKYSPPGSAIEVAALAGGVEVRDRGPGIADGEEEQVFERFHRGGAGRGGGAPRDRPRAHDRARARPHVGRGRHAAPPRRRRDRRRADPAAGMTLCQAFTRPLPRWP